MMLGHTLLSFLLALAILVFVHEMGHYLAARACGVKVLRFSIGFGPTLAMRRLGPDRTEWALAAIPLGGYVRMLDERDPPAGGIGASELSRAFTRQSLGRRSFIVAAGPAANFLLAILLYAWLAWSGVAEPAAVVQAPAAGTPAAQAGFQAGDRVAAIDGQPVRGWNEMRLRLLDGVIERRPIEVEVERGGATRRLALATGALAADEIERDFSRTLGLEPAVKQVEIAQVLPDSPAERAGLRAADAVRAVDGEPVARADALIARIRESAGRPVRLTVQRGEATLDVEVTPQLQPASTAAAAGGAAGAGGAAAPVPGEAAAPPRPSGGRIGAALTNRTELVRVQAGPLQALARGVEQTRDMSLFSLRMLGRMVTGELSWKNLSGPVSIADYAGQSARVGWQAYVGFMALISVSLAVLNLLPVPVLDGGHLVYYGLEAALRRPLPARFVELTQRAGLGLIMAMMVLALFNDITRLLGS